jgi:hypothetical protein
LFLLSGYFIGDLVLDQLRFRLVWSSSSFEVINSVGVDLISKVSTCAKQAHSKGTASAPKDL